VRRVACPGEGSLRDLLDLAQPVAMQAFDKDRPLWELHQVEGLADGRAAIVIKLHHAVSDGVGLVRMTSSLVERTREADPGRPRRRSVLEEKLEEPEPRSPFDEAIDALRYRAGTNLRAAGALGRGARELLRRPVEALGAAGQLAGSIGRALRPISEPMSPIMRGRSLAVRFDVLELPLEALKGAARAAGGTLNDAFVGAVTGGLRRYHEHHGRPVAELRMTMPINLREGEEGDRAGNQFSPARFAVPLMVEGAAERMKRIHELVVRQREEPALPLLEGITGVLSRLPHALQVNLAGSMLKAIDFVTSNVPGPPFTVYASGARVERMFGFGPLSGAAANVTLFSYDGTLHLAVNSDPAAVPDPSTFLLCLRGGLGEVLALAGPGGPL